MKAPVFYLSLAFVLTFISTPILSAQVGIGTKTPRATLEIAGDTNISGNLEIGDYKSLNDADFSSFLIQESDNSIKSLDVSNPTGVALAYIQEYIIENPNLDWVKNFDTGVDATDFVMVATSASFDLELDLTDNNGTENNASLPYTATFVENGTWHIVTDYPQAANLDENAVGTWTIQTLIFSSDVSKQYGTVSIPMSNTSTGSATAPIIN